MTISLIFDIVIAVICLFIIIKNAARGFIKSFLVFARTILSLLLAYVFSSPLGRVISERLVFGYARSWVTTVLESTKSGEAGYELYTVFDGIPDVVTQFLTASGIDEATINKYLVEENMADTAVLEIFADGLGGALSVLISVVIAFIVLLIGFEIVFGIIGYFLNKLGKLPVLKILNLLLGAAVGFAIAATMAWLISLGITQVFKFGSYYYPEVFDHKLIENSMIVSFFEKNNLWYIIKDYILN